MEHELTQSEDGIVAHFVVRVAHQSGQRHVIQDSTFLQGGFNI